MTLYAYEQRKQNGRTQGSIPQISPNIYRLYQRPGRPATQPTMSGSEDGANEMHEISPTTMTIMNNELRVTLVTTHKEYPLVHSLIRYCLVININFIFH